MVKNQIDKEGHQVENVCPAIGESMQQIGECHRLVIRRQQQNILQNSGEYFSARQRHIKYEKYNIQNEQHFGECFFFF